MGKNQSIRVHLASHERQIREHREKIRQELQKDFPDLGYIEHWEREILGWRMRIKKLRSRLRRER